MFRRNFLRLLAAMPFVGLLPLAKPREGLTVAKIVEARKILEANEVSYASELAGAVGNRFDQLVIEEFFRSGVEHV